MCLGPLISYEEESSNVNAFQKSVKPYHEDIIFSAMSYLLDIKSITMFRETLSYYFCAGWFQLSFTC